ncbi:MAG: hypothetical protein LBU77_00685 [Clostridiales bacterium]|jgi:hypothetical protein|nr:hypothetical protein [Clostridiales bacterium]
MQLIIFAVIVTVVGGIVGGIYVIINNAYRGSAFDKNEKEALRVADEITRLVTKYDSSIRTNHLHASLNAKRTLQYLYDNISDWQSQNFEWWLFGRSATKYSKGVDAFDPANSENKWSKEDIDKFDELKNKYIQYSKTASYHIGKYYSGSGNAAFNSGVARSNIPGYSAQAKKKLAAEQAKKDRNAVIKGAVVGGVVGGQAGAVVGAMAAKASNDAKNDISQSSGGSAAKSMVKGAVVGGLIGGDAGAVVGAMVAKEQHEHNKKDK